ncbi:MAG: hypothetical protein ACI9BW_004455, partial [Gammaproteobacteria bacterium]
MKHSLLILLFVTACWSSVQANNSIGEARFTRGVVTAQHSDDAIRILGTDAPLFEGDTLNTSKNSYAIVNLDDGTRMTLRPNTSFELQQFQPDNNIAVMRLLKGGVRALTGFISKRSPTGFRVRASSTTIGIRGTEFYARLCDEACEFEAPIDSTTTAPPALVVGRAALVIGTLNITSGDGRTRRAGKGAPLYEGDVLVTETASYAMLALQDEGRITLRAETEFIIQKLKFDRQHPDGDSAVFNLVRGGIRAFTGLIGKRKQNTYRVVTSVATIGIRGTGFDLVCQGTCGAPTSPSGSNDGPLKIEPTSLPPGDDDGPLKIEPTSLPPGDDDGPLKIEPTSLPPGDDDGPL